jgi:hypothetical protein
MAGNSITDHQQDHNEGHKRTDQQRIVELELTVGELLRRIKALENKTEEVDGRTFMFQSVGLN